MTLQKMLRVLEYLAKQNDGIAPHGFISAAAGEISIVFTSQPEKYVDDYMRQRGFIYISEIPYSVGAYVYRPR